MYCNNYLASCLFLDFSKTAIQSWLLNLVIFLWYPSYLLKLLLTFSIRQVMRNLKSHLFIILNQPYLITLPIVSLFLELLYVHFLLSMVWLISLELFRNLLCSSKKLVLLLSIFNLMHLFCRSLLCFKGRWAQCS